MFPSLERHPTTAPSDSATATQDTLNSSLTIRAFSLCPVSFTQILPVTDKFGTGFQDLNNLDAYKKGTEFKGTVGVSCVLLFTAGF